MRHAERIGKTSCAEDTVARLGVECRFRGAEQEIANVRSRSAHSGSAFTLIELMVVVAIIAVVALIVVAKLLLATRSAREVAAIGNLRAIANAQWAFGLAKIVDQDSDNSGEFGLLGELSGDIVPRAETAVLSSAMRIIPNLFRTGGSEGTDGCVPRTGYVYRVYLAASDDGEGSITVGDDKTLGGTSSQGGSTLNDLNAVNDQELYYVAYAWPQTADATAGRAFAITENRNICYTEMSVRSYSGRGSMAILNVPAANAVYTGTVFTSLLSSATTPGNDGNQWSALGTAGSQRTPKVAP